MAWVKCENCEKEYFHRAKHGDACPVCDTIIQPKAEAKAPEDLKENLVKQARDHAKVVDKFGEVLQVIGWVFIGIFALFVLWGKISAK